MHSNALISNNKQLFYQGNKSFIHPKKKKRKIKTPPLSPKKKHKKHTFPMHESFEIKPRNRKKLINKFKFSKTNKM